MAETQNIYSYLVEITGKVRISYKDSPAHTGRLKHAVDFICREGTYILAAHDGRVVDVKQDSCMGGDEPSFDRYGNYVEIEHPNGEYSIYEHIAPGSCIVQVGAHVKKGQLIAACGRTGYLGGLGPHVHFDVHKYFGEGPEDYETIEIRWEK